MSDETTKNGLNMPPKPVATVERLTELSAADLHDLCDAAEAAIRDGGGFGWLQPPPRHTLESFWKGVVLIKERDLFVGRLDGVIAGSCQIQRPPRNNEAQRFACTQTTFFVAPWARGHGLARKLIEAAEDHARTAGFQVLNLDVRETQRAAIMMYERLGYTKFGEHPHYALAGGRVIKGMFYYKLLTETVGAEPTGPSDSGG